MLQRSELDELLLSSNVVERLEALNQDGTLKGLFPEVHTMVGFGGGDSGHKDLWGHTKQVVAQTLGVAHLRWAALFHDVGKPLCFTRTDGEVSFHMHEGMSARLFVRAANRTKFFTDDERDKVKFLIYHLGHVEAYESHWSDSAVRRLRGEAGDHLDDLLALARADITTRFPNVRAKHHRRMKELKDRALDLTARDAIPPALPSGLGLRITSEFGVPPSPALGLVLTALKAVVEAGKIPRQADPQVLVDYIKSNPDEFPSVKAKS